MKSSACPVVYKIYIFNSYKVQILYILAWTYLVILPVKKIIISLTEGQLDELGKLVESGMYSSRAEAVRDAVGTLLGKEKLSKLAEETETKTD